VLQVAVDCLDDRGMELTRTASPSGRAAASPSSGHPGAGHDARSPRFRRTAALVGIAVVAVLSLSGCVKLDMNLTVQSDDKVDGTVVFAIDKSLLTMSGKTPEEAFQSGVTAAPFPTSATGGGSVTTTPYDKDGKYGETYTFTGMPLSSFNGTDKDGKANDSLKIVHEGGFFIASGVLDMGKSTTSSSGSSDSSASPLPLPSSLLASVEVTIALTFPGEVVEHTGTLDGTTVTWTPTGGEKLVISAKAKDSGATTAASVVTKVLPWAVAALVLLGLAALLMVVLRRSGSHAGSPADVPPSDAPDPGSYPPPAAPSSFAPPAPPTAPSSPAPAPPTVASPAPPAHPTVASFAPPAPAPVPTEPPVAPPPAPSAPAVPSAPPAPPVAASGPDLSAFAPPVETPAEVAQVHDAVADEISEGGPDLPGSAT
jgi:hypothetical protein